MDPQHHLVDPKASERSTEHVPEERNTKSPRDVVSHPGHQDEDQVGAADEGLDNQPPGKDGSVV
jgi:hypothetical protein